MTYSDNGSHVLGLTDGSQTSNSTTDDEDLGRRNFSGGGDLAGEESAELVGGLHDSSGAKNELISS